MRQRIFCKVSRTGKAVHPAGALLAEQVVYLASLTVVCEERSERTLIDERTRLSGAVQPDSVESHLTASITAAKAPDRIANFEPGDILSHRYHMTSVFMSNRHKVCRWLFPRMTPKQHLT